MKKVKTSIIQLSLISLALISTISHAEYRLHIPVDKSAISFASKPSDGNNGNESGGNNGNGESGSGGENETPALPDAPTTPEPTEPTEPTKTVAESCQEVVTALNNYMLSNGKTSVVGLSATQNAQALGGCPVNVAVTLTDYSSYSDLKNFIGSVISYGNSLKVFTKNNSAMTPVEVLGLKIIGKGNPSHLVYWTGSSYAQESSFSVYFK